VCDNETEMDFKEDLRMCVFLCLVVSTSGTPVLVERTSFGKIIKSNLCKI